MDENSLVKGYIANFGHISKRFQFLRFVIFFSVFQKNQVFLSILGPPYHGIGATIRIGREMLCVLYAGFFLMIYKMYFSYFSSFLDRNRPNTTKYALKIPKLLLKGLTNTKNKSLSTLSDPPSP